MKIVLTLLAKSVLILLRLAPATSATDGGIQKNIHGLRKAKLIILNEEMKDIMKIVKSHKESELLIKFDRETIKNEVKEQKGRFLNKSLGILATTSYLGIIGTTSRFIRKCVSR